MIGYLFDKILVRNIKDWGANLNWREFCNRIIDYLKIIKLKKYGILPKSSPVLIISNHNSILDSLVLGKVIERSDYHFVALAAYSLLGPKISLKAIPIFRKIMLNHLIFEYPLSLITRNRMLNLNKKIIQEKNRKSIAHAAQIINQGHVVSIFPTGSAGKKVKQLEWKPGVGYLVNQINNRKTQLIFVKITGTRRTNILLFLNPIIRKNFYKIINISVNFSKPILLSQVVNNSMKPKQVVAILEKKYNYFFRHAS